MTPLWVADWADRAWHPSSRGARLAHGVLKSLGALHGQVVRWRNRAYDRGRLRVERVPAHVIGVGNLTVGGSGKTPTVLWLAIALQHRGRRVAIVARGYGKQRRGVLVVSAAPGRRCRPATAATKP